MYVCSTKGFLRYEFAGLVFGGAYFRNFAVFCQKNVENSELKQKFQL